MLIYRKYILIFLLQFFRNYSTLSRKTRIYFEDKLLRIVVINAFILKKNKKDKLLNSNQSNTLIEFVTLLKTRTNLQITTIIILIKSIYNVRLNKQVSKRVYRLNNIKFVTYFKINSDTIIKKFVDNQQKTKSRFTKKVFVIDKITKRARFEKIINASIVLE